MLPKFRFILLIWGFLAFWRLIRGTQGPQTNIFQFVCEVLVVIYCFQAIWGLKHLDFINYNKI
jgi:hypothetical protein